MIMASMHPAATVRRTLNRPRRFAQRPAVRVSRDGRRWMGLAPSATTHASDLLARKGEGKESKLTMRRIMRGPRQRGRCSHHAARGLRSARVEAESRAAGGAVSSGEAFCQICLPGKVNIDFASKTPSRCLIPRKSKP